MKIHTLRIHMTDEHYARVAQQARDLGFGKKIGAYLLSLHGLKPVSGNAQQDERWLRLLDAARAHPLNLPFQVSFLLKDQWSTFSKADRIQLGRLFKDYIAHDDRFVACGRTSGNHMLYQRVK